MTFAAVVLAADRQDQDPVARISGAPCKTLTPLAGKPMLQRVLEALNDCGAVERIALCGPGEGVWRAHPVVLEGKPLLWIPPSPSPSLSAWTGMVQVDPNTPILLTSADLAFPDASVFSEFCHRARSSNADIAVGLVPLPLVTERYPEVRRTALKFADGPFCTCNLFAFLTPGGRELVHFWRRLEQQRKHPWRLVRELGFVPLICYLLGRLSTGGVSRQVQKRLGLRVQFVILEHPEAAIDIDTPEDLALVRRLLKGLS